MKRSFGIAVLICTTPYNAIPHSHDPRPRNPPDGLVKFALPPLPPPRPELNPPRPPPPRLLPRPLKPPRPLGAPLPAPRPPPRPPRIGAPLDAPPARLGFGVPTCMIRKSSSARW